MISCCPESKYRNIKLILKLVHMWLIKLFLIAQQLPLWILLIFLLVLILIFLSEDHKIKIIFLIHCSE